MSEFKYTSFNEPQEARTQPAIQSTPPSEPRRKRGGSKKFGVMSCFFIVLIFLVWIIYSVVSAANNSFFTGISNGFIIRQLTHIFNADANLLRGEKDDRINYLLLGMGGPGHEGPYLSDTIILASLQPSTGKVAMVSIPRDMIVPFGDGTYRKVNSIYALHIDRGIEQAFSKVKEVIGKSFGQEIHYMATVDFQGFVEIIDEVGGITIDVERPFTDYQFPTADYKTTTVAFEAGEQRMDGLTALRYARSRHGNNGEGSDFARSKRQQKIIISLKEKLTSFNTLINPVKITSLFNLVSEYTRTDIEPWEAVKVARMVKDLQTDEIQHIFLDDAPGGYLTGGISSLDGAYILQPRGGSYKDIQQLLDSVFDRSELGGEDSTILLQNGTKVPGLAATQVNELQKYGVGISRYGNALTQDYLTTAIYDYSKGAKPLTRKILEDHFGTIARENPPLDLVAYTVAKRWDMLDKDGNVVSLDFLVILGDDAITLEAPTLIETVQPVTSSTPTSTDGIISTSTTDFQTD